MFSYTFWAALFVGVPGLSVGPKEAPKFLYHCQNQDVCLGSTSGVDDVGGVCWGVVTIGGVGIFVIGVAGLLENCCWGEGEPCGLDGLGSDEYKLLSPSIVCCDLIQYHNASSTGASRPAPCCACCCDFLYLSMNEDIPDMSEDPFCCNLARFLTVNDGDLSPPSGRPGLCGFGFIARLLLLMPLLLAPAFPTPPRPDIAAKLGLFN